MADLLLAQKGRRQLQQQRDADRAATVAAVAVAQASSSRRRAELQAVRHESQGLKLTAGLER
jgi:hypothetical protein